MKFVEARTGREMVVGETVRYPGGEAVTLVDVDHGFASGIATIDVTFLEPVRVVPTSASASGIGAAPSRIGILRTRRQQVPLIVRFMHPEYRFQRVGFIPT